VWSTGLNIAKNIVKHFSPVFLVGGEDAVGLRHLVPGNGAIYVVELIFLVLGIMLVFRLRTRAAKVLVLWLISGLLPSILSIQSPHAVRGLMGLPAAELITGVGLVGAYRFVRAGSVRLGVVFLVVVASWLILNVQNYVTAYYGNYADKSAKEFQYGYGQALEIVNQRQKTKDKVIITTAYGHPYLYTLLYRQIKPKDFLSGALTNYEFRPVVWPEAGADTLYVGTPEEIDKESEWVTDVVFYPDGTEAAFVIAETGEN